MTYQLGARAGICSLALGLVYLLRSNLYGLATREEPRPSRDVLHLSKYIGLDLETWYGNPDNVGPSPYDFVPEKLQSGQRKIKLLFLLDFKDYLERMNSHSYELYVVILREA
jgi:hypothetical protein